MLILYMFIIILYGKLFVDSLPIVVSVFITIYLWAVNTAIIGLYTAVNRIIHSISTGNIIGIIAWLIVLFGLAYLIPLLGLSPVLLAQETDREEEEINRSNKRACIDDAIRYESSVARDDVDRTPATAPKKRKPANKPRQACLRWFTTDKTVITNQPGTEGHTGVVTHGSLPTSLKLTDTTPQSAKLLLEAIVPKNRITVPVINKLKADTNFKTVPSGHILHSINCMILLSDKSTVKVELTEPGEPMEAQLFHPTNHHGILSYPGNAHRVLLVVLWRISMLISMINHLLIW